MAFDLKLADRVREALVGQKDVRDVKMFQGMCFMVDDKMCICLRDDRLMCRVIHGKRMMKGFVFVHPEGYKAKKDFDYWIKSCLEFNKIAKPAKKRR